MTTRPAEVGGTTSAPADRVVITIDGPAGTGKSTVAHRLAARLGLEFLDTGAMYRAAALIALEHGIDPADGAALSGTVAGADIHFDWSTDPPCIMTGDRGVTDRIRDLDVSAIVSIVAAQPALRRILVEQQRRIAERHPRIVTEGRDQGSIVFPDATLRFFLDADLEVRAERRGAQLSAAGSAVDHQRVVADIVQRDRLDASREDGPLIRPEGAITVDTGAMTIDEVVGALEAIAREHLPGRGLGS